MNLILTCASLSPDAVIKKLPSSSDLKLFCVNAEIGENIDFRNNECLSCSTNAGAVRSGELTDGILDPNAARNGGCLICSIEDDSGDCIDSNGDVDAVGVGDSAGDDSCGDDDWRAPLCCGVEYIVDIDEVDDDVVVAVVVKSCEVSFGVDKINIGETCECTGDVGTSSLGDPNERAGGTDFGWNRECIDGWNAAASVRRSDFINGGGNAGVAGRGKCTISVIVSAGDVTA